jgi:hypothetical protein
MWEAKAAPEVRDQTGRTQVALPTADGSKGQVKRQNQRRFADFA